MYYRITAVDARGRWSLNPGIEKKDIRSVEGGRQGHPEMVFRKRSLEVRGFTRTSGDTIPG